MAGGAAFLLHGPAGMVMALAALLLLELALQIAAAMRQRQHIVTRVDPFLWRVLLYAGLLILSALAAPYLGLPSTQAVAGLLIAAEASSILRQLEQMGAIPPGILPGSSAPTPTPEFARSGSAANHAGAADPSPVPAEADPAPPAATAGGAP